MQLYILGVDVGTGSTKAVAVAKDGSVLCAHQAFYPEGTSHTEQDPEVIWTAFATCVGAVVRELQAQPAAVSFSAAMHSIMALDAANLPLSPLLTWADDRAAAIAEKLLHQSLGEQIYKACGTPIHALAPLCKIAWWRHHDATLFASARRFAGIKEWLWHRLFGVWEIDQSLASATGMLELHTGGWYQPALQFATVAADQLSTPVPTTHQRSGMDVSVAAVLGLDPDTVFVIGASDGCLANLGTAALEPGVAAITVGTSGAVRMAASLPQPKFPEQLFNYQLTPGHWITGGAINNGGAAIEWCADLLYGGLAATDLAAAAAVAPGADGLLFLPFLLGERAPIWDSHASAAFVGLRQQHGRHHLLRAALEGVCMALRSVLEPLQMANGPVSRLHLSGGFSRSPEALQILSDITGKEVVRLQSEDASAIGAAYLGFLALGWIGDISELPPPEVISRFQPDQARHEQYSALYKIYKPLYGLLQQSMHQLRELSTANI